MKRQERISHEAGDSTAWLCLCGNKPSEKGFYPSDETGVLCRSDSQWKGFYRCDKCGRVIGEDLLVVGNGWLLDNANHARNKKAQ